MKAIIYGVLVLFFTSCSSVTPVPARNTVAALSPHPFDFYTRQLADNLFVQLSVQGSLVKPGAEIAVASFVPVNSLSLAQVDEAKKKLANQLAESMLTHARQHGFNVYDYRLRQQLLLTEDHEQALSRQLADIQMASTADTMLTGTYTAMEDGVMLNARLIRVHNKQVLAAASGYIPANVFWSRQQVTKRGDKLYRQQTTGEIK
jgi:TolB-like protein